MTKETTLSRREFLTESYSAAQEAWPSTGKHILAQYDDESVVVYQAYNAQIANYAVEHQTFAECPHYNPHRMTWIKTNFLWMMYRCGWATKDANQTRVLAIWLKRSALDRYLQQATTNKKNPTGQTVRLQWDPDHLPKGGKHDGGRRAIQLGLKGVIGFVSGADILQIQDITAFVDEQRSRMTNNGTGELQVPRERIYEPECKAAQAVGVDRIQ